VNSTERESWKEPKWDNEKEFETSSSTYIKYNFYIIYYLLHNGSVS